MISSKNTGKTRKRSSATRSCTAHVIWDGRSRPSQAPRSAALFRPRRAALSTRDASRAATRRTGPESTPSSSLPGLPGQRARRPSATHCQRGSLGRVPRSSQCHPRLRGSWRTSSRELRCPTGKHVVPCRPRPARASSRSLPYPPAWSRASSMYRSDYRTRCAHAASGILFTHCQREGVSRVTPRRTLCPLFRGAL